MAPMSYFVVQLLWRLHVVAAWRERRRKRKEIKKKSRT
jgi:uncharacterized protein YjiS (DUF1127 family)